MSISDAVKISRLDGLEALRDRLAEQIDACASARDVASLSRQLTEVLEQIEDLTPKEDEIDALSALVPDGDAG